MAKIAVIGAGAMGLATAYHLLKQGHQVEIFETDDQVGGMAAHFNLGNISIERYYHFICKSDQSTFDLLNEIGLIHKLQWRQTSMGFFYKGKIHPLGNPLDLLRFPHLSFLSKLRYGSFVFFSTKRSNWQTLDKISAMNWLRKWIGKEAWEVLWEKLFTLKFFEYSPQISAAWIWTRIKRVGTSRRSLFQEELGYLDGGSETLINRLAELIKEKGGKIHLSSPVREVNISDNKIKGITVNHQQLSFDHVISTIPFPLVPKMIPGLPTMIKEQYANVKNIGVVCVVHQLKRSISSHFWVNINDDKMDIPGIIQFSNLRAINESHVVYIPYYMPITHPKFDKDETFFIDETFKYLQYLNPNLKHADLLHSAVGKLKYAQPICTTSFLESLPPIQSCIEGLQIADTSVYYPEDRGIAESVRIGKKMAEAIK